MSKRSGAVGAIAALVFAATLPIAAAGAEIKVISAVAIRPLLEDAVPRFERATGHKVTLKFVTGPNVQRDVEAGEVFDVAITNPGLVDALVRQGKIVGGTPVSFARAGAGVCSRAGAAKPDISTVDAFKRTLLEATSVSFSAEGTSGAYFLALLDRLQIAADMKAKLRPQPGGAIPQAVARGEAELCITVMSQLVPIVQGAQLLGPVPSDLQTYIGFAAGIGASAKEPKASASFVEYLAAPEVAALFSAYGLERMPR